MGMRSREKGKRGEREVASMLRPIVQQVYEAHELEPPLIQRNAMQSDKGGYDIVGLDWLAVEVKYVEQEALDKWWAQAVEQARPDQVPVLFYRKNKTSWNVMMFAYLGEPSCGHTAPVTVSFREFALWLRMRINLELTREQEAD